MYGVRHPYKYFVERTYKAFIPNFKFLEQGWDLKVGAVVPLKVMGKTIVGLLLAIAANKARLDSTTQVLLDSYRDLSDVQRVGLRCHLGLKALLYSCCVLHCLRWVFLFVNVIGLVGQPLPPLPLRNVLQ